MSKKKLHDAAGRASVSLDAQPRPKFPAPVVFDTPEVTRVCNASSKEAYKPPAWPSARVSAADAVKSRGWA